MEAKSLEERIRLGEDSSTEFKGVVQTNYRADSKTIAKEVVAFANSGGGLLILGVENDGTVTGVGSLVEADRLMRQISTLCQDSIEPPITCKIDKGEVHGSLVLAVEVPGFSPDRPYRTNHVRYVRDGAMSREARPDEEKRLFDSGPRMGFDEQPVQGASALDLDETEARKFIETVFDPTQIPDVQRYLRALKCLLPAGTPTVAGILFFGREVATWLPDARIVIVRNAGTVRSSTLLDRKEVSGRIHTQVDLARDVLGLMLPTPAKIEGWERKELPGPGGIPSQVLREVLTNAVMHRDYRVASNINIWVFDDRIEVINPGGLLNELTLDSILLGGISQRRNPVIASMLNRLRRSESVGLGIPEVIQRMREAGLPEPDFSVRGGHFIVTLRTLRQP